MYSLISLLSSMVHVLQLTHMGDLLRAENGNDCTCWVGLE